MTYHVHPPNQIRDLEEFIREIINTPGVLETFAGAGTTGIVPDPLTESHRALSDTGAWRPATRVFFQSTTPTTQESSAGDLWLVTT